MAFQCVLPSEENGPLLFDKCPLDLDRIFLEYVRWQYHNWPVPSLERSMIKTTEELGELAAGVYRGDKQKMIDALGDLVIAAMGVAVAIDVNLPNAVADAWRVVRRRDYKKYPKTGRQE